MMPTVRALLKDGLARLREHGWRQHAYGSPHQGYCASGCMLPLAPRGIEWIQATRALERASQARVYVEGAPVPMTLADWNDTPGRTQAEVEALFEAAIAAESVR